MSRTVNHYRSCAITEISKKKKSETITLSMYCVIKAFVVLFSSMISRLRGSRRGRSVCLCRWTGSE